MKKYKIIITETFKEEMNAIYNYLYFFLNEPVIAKNIYNNVIKSISSLMYFPQRFYKIKSKNKSNLRKFIFNKFIIIYEISITQNQVTILHIYHEKQDYLNLL